LGDYKKSLEYYQLYKEAVDNILQQDNKDLIAMLESDFENEKTQNQIVSLVREKELSDLRAQQARNMNIGIGVIFLVMILVGILFIRQNKLQNEHKNTILEQKLLRLQMNPHFIFNALSSIHSLLNPSEVEKASTYVGKFSRLLRTTLESSREDFILLEDEINSLSHYLELQQLRYDHKFGFSIEVDEKIDTENAIIPPMIIQPFVENAIEHGVRHRPGKGHITIRFLLRDKQIVCEVEDDGVGRRKAWETKYTRKQKHKSLATEIIQDRIKILNKKFRHNIKLEIIDLQNETQLAMGTLVRLNLPYLLD
jgi:LytS/YehU family sensor histidine kinase